MKNEHGYCPHCGANWDGADIPKESQQYYGGSTKFGRQIGIDGGYMGIYDGVVAWECPDCNKFSPRGDSEWAMELFERFSNYRENNE